ncbi:MAG: hypothetical protein IJ130_10710 [Solobacterium sp.]|nr:hypothetical protein [Solobacterium sp.]
MLSDRGNIVKKVLLSIALLLGVNLLTNYRFFYRFFYRGPQLSYTGNDCRTDEHFWQIENINEEVNVIELTYTDQPYYLSVSYTSDEFANYEHFNPSWETDKTQKDYMFIYAAMNMPVKNLLIFAGNGSLDQIILNPRVSYHLNGTKTVLYWLILMGIWFIFSDGRTLVNDRKQLARSALAVVLLTGMSWNLARDYSDQEGMDDLYARYYTDTLISGSLELDYPTDAAEISNDPYDTSDRSEDILWDATYYNGKYYAYFGVLPAAVLMVPYKLATGNYLSSAYGMLVYLFGCFAAGLLLFREIVRKYFPQISFRMFMLSYLYIVFGSKLIWSANRPLFYEMLVCAAFFHVMLGLYLVQFGKSRVHHTVGYLSLALTALCRPTFLLASVLIVPGLIRKLKEKRFGIADFLCLMIPYGVIGLLTMYLNYVRFGSVLEFGISYQLTANSMLYSRFSLLKALTGSFMYLFDGFTVKLLPFTVAGQTEAFPLVSDFFMETAGGGFVPVSVIGILIPVLMKHVKNRELKMYLYLCLGLALAQLIISTGVGSLVGRYMADFNYLLYFAVTAEFLYIMHQEQHPVIADIYVCAVSASIFLNYFLALSNI